MTASTSTAKLTAKQIDQVDGSLIFKGLVARYNWLAQTAALAKGGEAEYMRVFGKKPR